MKMNIKGLVFVGFAAAVFASAANAASDKIVTSKTYVDGKVVNTLEGDETDKAPSVHAVKDLVGAEYTGQNGIAVDENHVITNAGVRTVTATPSTGTDGTITVNTDGSSAEVAVKGLKDAAYLGKDESIDSSSTYNDAATAKAVYDFATSADRQSNWTQSDSAKPDFIKNKPGNFGGATETVAGSAGFVPAPAAGDQGKVLGGNGQWLEVETTDTTYEFAEGTANGTISVTEEGGSAQDIAVHGLDDAAYKDVDTAISSDNATSTNLPTTQAVYDFVTTPTNILPTNAACTGTQPCALVFDGTNVTWEKIQQ